MDMDKIQKAYAEAKVRAQAERYAYERDWFRNLLFYLGIQWVVYAPQTRKWVPRNLKKWTPRPVTNKFAAHANTIIQVLSARPPDTTCRPATDSPEDIATAEVANKNFNVILAEADQDEVRQMAALWSTLTGTAFLHPCWDASPVHGTVFIPHSACPQCSKEYAPDDLPEGQDGVCPGCQVPLIPAQKVDGSPKGEKLPRGRMAIEVFSPFEVYIDFEARSMAEVQQLIVRRRYPIDQVKMRWGRYDVEPDRSHEQNSTGLNLLRAVAYASGAHNYGTGVASGRGIGDDLNVTVDYFWQRPSKEFPEGIAAVYAGEKCLNEKEAKEGIPYRNKKGDPIFPWHILQFDRVPGRIFGKTPLDDAAPKQEQRNKLESMIELIVKRCSNPVWLQAKGTGLTMITGEPGQIIEGNWNADPRLKPERVPGDNVPTSLLAWMEKIDKDMEQICGCLTGDTMIPCLDGEVRSMRELSIDFPYGGMWVYGFDQRQMRVVPAKVERAWKTKIDKCVRVKFREGTHVDCTPDHPFLTWDRGYVEAKDLVPDDSIVPLQIRERGGGYLGVLQPVDYRDEQVHRMVAQQELGLPFWPEGSKLDVHHKDGNPSNNIPENLEVLTRSEHVRRDKRSVGRKMDPGVQSQNSRKRWDEMSPEDRVDEVTPMLMGRKAAWSQTSYIERSRKARETWAKIPESERVVWREKISIAKTHRSNHRVESVTQLEGEHEVYDLQTSTCNFGTLAGVFVHNTFEVLQGNAPAGVTAGTALRLLLERAVTRFTPCLQRLEKVWRDVCADGLAIFQQNATDDRMSMIQGPGNTWEVQRFSAADLPGNVDIVVEAGSAAPKNTVGNQALIQDLANMGVINPQMPETQYRILQEFGQTRLLGEIDLNIKHAKRENWRFLNEQKPPMLNPILDEHQSHLMVHRELALTSDFEVMPPEMQKVWLNHLLEHQMAMMPPQPEAPPESEGAPQGEGQPAGPGGGGQPVPAPGQPPMPPSSMPEGQDAGMPPMFPGEGVM